ncbi:MAG TPA: hypothetical protein PKW17_03940 [Smithellaceae bacterium]|nr:hypothetical protein [Smithellaceae bacterium]
MKKIIFLSIAIFIVLFFAAFTILPSYVLSKEKAASKLDCSWKCDKKKMECVCSGNDCQTCAGNEGKAYGGAIMKKIRVCRVVSCEWFCAGYTEGRCSVWRQVCIEECEG